jgi:hypothetical protein
MIITCPKNNDIKKYQIEARGQIFRCKDLSIFEKIAKGMPKIEILGHFYEESEEERTSL